MSCFFFKLARTENGLPLILKVVLGRSTRPLQLQNAFPRDGQWHNVTITRDRNEVHLGVDSETPGTLIMQHFKWLPPPDFHGSKVEYQSILLKWGYWVAFISIVAEKGVGRSMRFHMDENSEIFLGGLPRRNSFEGCIKDVRLNGQSLPRSKSNGIATETISQGR